MRRTSVVALISVLAGSASVALAFPPAYNILDIGILPGDANSQGNRISPGGVATGRSLPNSGAAHAYSWTQGGGQIGLPSLASPSRPFSVGNGVNDNGQIVGAGATTAFGSSRLPLIWNSGVVSQLPLPAGQTLGDANDINQSGIAVGSANSGSLQRGVIYQGGTGTFITQTTPGGSFILTAFSINDSGRIVGQGIDPNNAARNVGYVYDIGSASAFEVGALPGFNGALTFDVSNAGHVVGSSMLNQGSGLPFIWTQANGIQPIPLPIGTSQGSARGVNSNGWAVGTASSAFAIPFLYDGVSTYRIQDLIPGGSGWDLSTNTSSSAMSISESGIIVGSGVFNGAVHAYALVPVPEPMTIALLGLGAVLIRRRVR